MSLLFLAFLQTSGLVVYILLIACFFNFVAPNLPIGDDIEGFFGPLIMLTLFVMSAVISATLILGRAAVLFWEKNYKDAFTLVLWNVAWGFVYLALLIVYLLLLK